MAMQSGASPVSKGGGAACITMGASSGRVESQYFVGSFSPRGQTSSHSSVDCTPTTKPLVVPPSRYSR
jgi:hypothetical protein